MSSLDLLANQLHALDLNLDDAVIRGLGGYIRILEHWNRTINLTGLRGAELVRRLVAEPLWVAARLAPAGSYLDIGSGNGSPAIPWLLACGFDRADLVESRMRRAVFLRRTAAELGLGHAHVHCARFDEFLDGPDSEAVAPGWVTLQGVRLTRELMDEIARAGGVGTRIVWLTKDPAPPLPPLETLQIPNSDRCAVVFQV